MSNWLITRLDRIFNTPANNVHDGVIGHPFLIPVTPHDHDYVEGLKFGDVIGAGDGAIMHLSTDVWASTRRQEMHTDPNELPDVDPSDFEREPNQLTYYLSAISNGLLSYVPDGVTKEIPGTDCAMPTRKTVTGPAYILKVIDSASQSLGVKLNRDLWILPDLPHRRPRPTVIVYENIDNEPADELENLIKAYMSLEKKPPVWNDPNINALYASWLAGDSTVYVRAGFHIGWPRAAAPDGVEKPGVIASADHRFVRITIYDEFGLPFDLGWFLRHAHKMRKDDFFYDVTGPNSYLYSKHPLLTILSYRNIVDLRDEIGRPYQKNFYFDSVQIGNKNIHDLDIIVGIAQNRQTGPDGIFIDETPIPVGAQDINHQDAVEKWIGIENHLLAFLPNCPSSAGALKATGYLGDYYRIQAFDVHKWFPEQPTALPDRAPERFHLACRVIPLVDGQVTHGVLTDAIRATYEDDSRAEVRHDRLLQPLEDRQLGKVWLCNWVITPDLFPYGETPAGRQAINDAQDGADAEDLNAFERGEIGYPVNSLGYYLQKSIAAGVNVRLLPWYNILGTNRASKNIEICNAANKYYNFDAYHPMGGGVSSPEDRAPVTFDPDADTSGHNRGFGMIDPITRTAGSHHQKVSLIKNRYGFIGFLGGIDLQTGRWDTHAHDTDPRKLEPGSGWHDIHAMLQGPILKDIYKNFIQRWNAFLENQPAPEDPYPIDLNGVDFIPPAIPDEDPEFWPGPNDMAMAQRPKDETDATAHLDRGNEGVFYGRFTQIAAIVRTIPERLDQYSDFVAANEGDGAPLGELGCLRAYTNAIQNARQFIYIEDQYFTNAQITQLLVDRLTDPNPMRRLKRVMVVIPKILNDHWVIDEINYYFRQKYINQITQAVKEFMANTSPDYNVAADVPNSVAQESFCAAHLVGPDLENDADDQIYIHAKHMIVDDAWMVISSSNINNRSMTHDSEIGVAISDAEVEGGARKAVRDHRIRLWAEHLHLQRKEWFRLLDPIQGITNLHKSLEDGTLPLIPYVQRPLNYHEDTVDATMSLLKDKIGDPDGRENIEIFSPEAATDLLAAIANE